MARTRRDRVTNSGTLSFVVSTLLFSSAEGDVIQRVLFDKNGKHKRVVYWQRPDGHLTDIERRRNDFFEERQLLAIRKRRDRRLPLIYIGFLCNLIPMLGDLIEAF